MRQLRRAPPQSFAARSYSSHHPGVGLVACSYLQLIVLHSTFDCVFDLNLAAAVNCSYFNLRVVIDFRANSSLTFDFHHLSLAKRKFNFPAGDHAHSASDFISSD